MCYIQKLRYFSCTVGFYSILYHIKCIIKPMASYLIIMTQRCVYKKCWSCPYGIVNLGWYSIEGLEKLLSLLSISKISTIRIYKIKLIVFEISLSFRMHLSILLFLHIHLWHVSIPLRSKLKIKSSIWSYFNSLYSPVECYSKGL